MKRAEIKALADEYNAIIERGRELYAECGRMATRCNEIRKTIDEVAPNSYDPIALLFGAELDVDLEMIEE